MDYEARYERLECNITTYSSSGSALQLADRVATELKRMRTLIIDVSTSGSHLL